MLWRKNDVGKSFTIWYLFEKKKRKREKENN